MENFLLLFFVGLVAVIVLEPVICWLLDGVIWLLEPARLKRWIEKLG